MSIISGIALSFSMDRESTYITFPLLGKILKSGSKTFQPWFSYDHKVLDDVENIIFGHWAALNGVTNHNNIKGIDLGCVWGGSLAAINVEDKSIITVDSR